MNQFKISQLGEIHSEWKIQTYAYIGRDFACNVFLNGEKVDKKHALIEVKETGLYIKDLKSAHGTFLNGTKIIEAKLSDGDIISIGEIEFLVHDLQVIKNTFSLESKNEKWNEQLQMLASVARTTHPVLLLGPSGTGKDVLAQELHKNSNLAEAPFISVNCSALTETLVESELFGHVKGSFTGAVADRKGAFEAARNGTLFLDEIGDLSYNLQAKLLRALENNEIRPVGSDKTIKTKVRIIAATHQNLNEKIREGLFRSDLYYRLNVIAVDVPTLKNRMEDFESLLYRFARDFKVRFSYQAIEELKKHSWQGNIRELKNVVVRASALFPKEYIQPKHLSSLLGQNENNLNIVNVGESSLGASLGTLSVIKEIEKQMIIKRLTANYGNQKRTARDLGMPKSTLHDRIKNYKININTFKGEAMV